MSRHSEQVRVEFADTDAGGLIHHTAALRWAERAEHQLLRSLGRSERNGSELIGPELTRFPRRRLEVDFLGPLRFGDEVVVEIAATAVGRTSVTYRWQVLRDGVSCVEGTTTCVHVDDAGLPSPVPAALRAALVT
ncbi:acyl-CoA thioesterase [Promicromonospora sp. CA-289599]|uniref:acyl-CoA thioesterase n=1 Tax=Promicromonospora sp. CA-289599 TaxID=3240014 RepID=UPI003D8EE5D4